MSLTQTHGEVDDFSVQEWQRLDSLSTRFDRQLKMAYTITVARGNPLNTDKIEEAITDCVVETGVTTARVYNLAFNPQSPIYLNLIDTLTANYVKVVNNDSAKEKVKEILPNDLPLAERRRRLDVFGLDARAAVRLERMRQRGTSPQALEAARIDMSVQRGNLIALTEVNRIINATTEAVWIDNSRISKARRKTIYGGAWYRESGGTAGVITTLRGVPAKAKKRIVTRKDNRVCDYCEPLDQFTAPLGSMFNTRYGLFKYPPFHPRCRCFMIVSW
jgi:hypothetical protein